MGIAVGSAASFILVLLLIPVLRRLALATGYVDRPGGRKVHSKPVPLLGGVALYIGIAGMMAVLLKGSALSLAIAVGGLPLIAVGLADDRWKTRGMEFPVWPRVLVYVSAGLIPQLFGIRIEGVSRLGSGGMIFLPEWIAVAATVLWIFALINMINFIDGIDGLAGGVAAISAVTLLVAALMKGHAETALLGAIIAGACLGFVGFNFYPARIFMGDAGAAFLGYALAVTAVNGAFKSTTLLSVLVPLLALGVPILDTGIVMTRRLLSGKGLHRADKLHAHHMLMRWGLSQVQAAAFLYLIAAIFALLSIVVLLISA